MGHGDNPLEHLPVCNHAEGKSCTDPVCKNDLYGAMMKGQKQSLHEAVPPEYFLEVQSLLCLLDDHSGVDLGIHTPVCLFSSTP